MTYDEILLRIEHAVSASRSRQPGFSLSNLHQQPHLVKEFLNAIGYGIDLVQQAGIGKVAGILDSGFDLGGPQDECTSVTVLTNRALEDEDIEIESAIWGEVPMGPRYADMCEGPGGFVFIVVEEKLSINQRDILTLPSGTNKVLIWSKRKGKFDGMG